MSSVGPNESARAVRRPLRTGSVDAALLTHAEGDVPSGELVATLLRTHSLPLVSDFYVDSATMTLVSAAGCEALGPVRSAQAHLDRALTGWSGDIGKFTGRHFVLALALEPELGAALLTSGAIGSLLSRWTPGHPPEEPRRLVWDALSDEARQQVLEQPLLAAAYGAPPDSRADLSDEVRSIAWSPRGDRLAVLTQSAILELDLVSANLRRLSSATLDITSVGWDKAGVVSLNIKDGHQLRRVPDGTVLASGSEMDGKVSGDGSELWLTGTDGLVARGVGSTSSRPVISSQQSSDAPRLLGTDYAGARGVVALGSRAAVVSLAAGGALPGPTVWSPSDAPLLGWTSARALFAAPLDLDGIAVAIAISNGVELRAIAGDSDQDSASKHPEQAPAPESRSSDGPDPDEGPLLATLALGGRTPTALAIDRTGTRVAVAVAGEIRVWSIGLRHGSGRHQPRYDNDRPEDAADLLDTNHDARVVAALLASRDLKPPLSVGLFGDWGSGKSFLLHQITRILEAEQPEGFLEHVRVVEFNAWQYAETNIWASLVNAVLRGIGPLQDKPLGLEATRAAAEARDAETALDHERARLAEAEAGASRARAVLARRRRTAGLLLAAALLVAVAAVVLLLVSPGSVAAIITAATSMFVLVGSAAAALRKANQEANTLLAGADETWSTGGRLLGVPEAQALRQQEQIVAEQRRRVQGAENTKDQCALAKAEAQEREVIQPLQVLLDDLETAGLYRDELTMVSRVHEHFTQIDQAVREDRAKRAPSARHAAGSTAVGTPESPQAPTPHPKDVDRVVVLIDDLDRCPPEKVVQVLETMHLLFDFELFAVVLAVDTRWLEQSLRIRYRQLLGRADTASPMDYLEKIVQIPLQLTPLDDSSVRRLIEGLTAQRVSADPNPAPYTTPSPEPQPKPPVVPALEPTTPRPPVQSLPATVLEVSAREATALAEVSQLVGTTPRTVKRFVNTFRLVKAGSATPETLDRAAGTFGNHDAVAFLLAILIGLPDIAPEVLTKLRTAPAGDTVQQTLRTPNPVAHPDSLAPPHPDTSAAAQDRRRTTQTSKLNTWLSTHPAHADAPVDLLRPWLAETARYSFQRPS